MLTRIQELCREKGTSVSKLEKELGFSNGSMYKWDTNSPSVDRVQKVADHFGVPIDYLVRKTVNN
jgi:transcriptional regulator with XRE-family HTH domain